VADTLIPAGRFSRDADTVTRTGAPATPWTLGSRWRRVGSTAGAGVLAKLVVFACNLALVPALIDYLGASQFGIWAAYQSIHAVILFADFGIGNGMQNAVTVAIAHGDTRKAHRLVSSSTAALLLAATAIGAVVGAVGSQPALVSRLLGEASRGADVAALHAGVSVFLATGLVAIPLSCGDRLALAMQQGFVSHLSRALGAIGSFVSVLVLIRANASFAAICLATSAPILAGPLLSWILVARRQAWAAPALSDVNIADMYSVLRSGAGFLAVQLTAIFGFGLDAILIERFAGSVEAANYAVVQRLFSIVAMTAGISLAPLWPAYADARARADFPWIKKTLQQSLIGTATIAGVLSISIALLAAPVASRWLGTSFVPPPSLVIAFAAWSFVMACGMAFSYFWNGMHMLTLQAVLGLVFVAVGLPAKLMALQAGTAASLVAVNAVAYAIVCLVPGALVTAPYVRFPAVNQSATQQA